MKKMYVKDILEKSNGEVLCGDPNKEIKEISIDTRTIQKGQTYLALKGENVDGIIYCRDAIEKGAEICFIEKNIFSIKELEELKDKVTIVKVKNVEDTLVEMARYKRELYDIPVIGITGSVGKTSTKDVISAVMEQKYKVQKTKGNNNNRIGVPLTIMGLKDHNALIVEMGMNHFGEIRELTQIAKPTICVISNIGTSHIGNLGSRENILKAKLEILEGMKNGKVIINNDNDLLHKWKKEDKKYKKITFGINEIKSDYVANSVKMQEDGNQFSVKINNRNYKFTTKKAGEPFVLNALSAIAVGKEFNIPIQKIQKAIAEVELTKNRMDIEKKNGILIIKDYYNASFESIKPSLEYLSSLKGGNKIAVLGDIKEVGKFSKELHEKVGEEVQKNNIDILITVGTEAKYIANSAMKCGMEKEKIFSYRNNIQATKKLKEIAKTDDKILLKASNSMKFGEIFEGFLRKYKVAIIVGGMSSEHDISLLSGKAILENIEKEKYDIKIIYINKNSKVYEYTGKIEEITKPQMKDLKKENNILDAVEDCDIVFPVLHGKYGEDGCIQGALEMIKKPYIGCGVFSSGACMDKEFTKKLVAIENIPVAKALIIKKKEHNYTCNLENEINTITDICKRVENEIGYNVFVKPAREGSSFGVTKATNRTELKEAIREAERFDDKILIEEEIIGKELECAVLGNNEIISSEVGEIKAAEEFYSFDAKYNNSQSKTVIPAKIDQISRDKIKEYAEKAYKVVGAKGLSRVDFFLKKNGEIILNEINTMPGFTKISMYPKLFNAVGIKYSELIDRLIKLAIEE